MRNCCPAPDHRRWPGGSRGIAGERGVLGVRGVCLILRGQLSGLLRPHWAEQGAAQWTELPPECTQGPGGKHGSQATPSSCRIGFCRWERRARYRPLGAEFCSFLGLGSLWSPSTPIVPLLPHNSTPHHGTVSLLARLSPCIKASAL